MKYNDKQEEQSVPTDAGTGQQTVVVNAASADIYGLELDFAARITDAFMLTGNLGLLDASYNELVDPPTGTDLSDLDLRRAPPVTATLSPSYTMEGSATFWVQADLRYIGEQELTFLNSPQSQVEVTRGDRCLDQLPVRQLDSQSLGFEPDRRRLLVAGIRCRHRVSFPGLWTYASARAPMAYGVRLMVDF